MLACMPHSPQLLTDHYHHPSATPTSTMSLAILPSSPATYSQPPLLSSKPSPSKRPKLSLNTSISPPTFGKKATSLRLETLSATSPTIRNTFSNAHDEDSNLKGNGFKPKRPTLSNLSTSNIISCDIPSSTSNTSEQLDATSLSSSTSANSTSTTDSIPASVPYKLAYNVTSILSNSPLPRSNSQRRTFAQSRPMFPVSKKVAFRAPLTEDITNEKFTLRHSDIESSHSTISTLELSPPEVDTEGEETASHAAQIKSEGDALKSQAKPAEKKKPSTSPRTGDKRDSSDEEDSDTCPATPVAGRKKRHREWVWTLGPIDSATQAEGKKQAQTQTDEAVIRDESSRGEVHNTG